MRLARLVAGAACVAAALAAGCGDDRGGDAGGSAATTRTATAAATAGPKPAKLRALCVQARARAPRAGATGTRARYRAQAGGEVLMVNALRAGGAERAGARARTLLNSHQLLSKALFDAATGPAEVDPFTRKQIRFLTRGVQGQARVAKLPECGPPLP
ncbi:MAG TPA: hypothetical protein VEX39_12030 [Thermoleophilaceae bacterium]|nr:hypothetical protein [Thermoleophilaceae bacterium]